jgi:uncharacterized protein (TIGR02598 family)
MNLLLPRNQSPTSHSGFSLVEVAMALGIFSFAIVGLVGLIPVSVATHKEAKVSTVLSQIQQRLTAELILTDGAKLSNLDGVQRNFDVEGREITSGPIAYSAKVVLTDVTLPGGATSTSIRRAVLIAVPNPSGAASLPADKATSGILVSKADDITL